MAKRKYELWKEVDDDAEALTFVEVNEDYERVLKMLVEPGAELIWTVEADTDNEAMQLYYDHMDWGTYKPMTDE